MEKNKQPLSTVLCTKDVKELFEVHGNPKKVRVGLLLGTDKLCFTKILFSNYAENKNVPTFEEPEDLFGHFVFYAYEKKPLFKKQERKVLISPLGLNTVFALPAKFVRFENPLSGGRQIETIVLGEQPVNEKLFTQNAYGKDHDCILEKMVMQRIFLISRNAVTCTHDVLVNHFKWTSPDPWVPTYFTKKDCKEACFFVNHKPEIKKYYGISYPERPNLFGYHIEE